MKHQRLFYFSFLILVFIGCNEQTKSKPAVDDSIINTATGSNSIMPDTARMNKELNINTVFLISDSSGAVCLYTNPNNNEYNHSPYFLSDTLNTLMIARIKEENGKLKLENRQVIDQSEWSYLTIDSSSIQQVKLNSKNYLYLSYRVAQQGKVVQEQIVNFALIELVSLNHYTLTFVGFNTFKCDDCLEGTLLKIEPAAPLHVTKFLKERAAVSKEIYHPSAAEKNPYHFLNYQDKWDDDNGVDFSYGAGHGDPEDPIKSTYYRTNLFDLNAGSLTDSLETDQYIIRGYFRGNIIAFDKAKQRYFPIIVEGCVHFCNKEIELNGNKLKLTYEDSENYTIDLSKMIFDIKQGN